ncbi:MAG TPA: ribonuclease P protein component 1 [Candidatus Thermoplasmatota archaeon]|nr:ribonuclease P protein component 1 [Candidatus Thermoplasmatota archaeon]
MSANADSHTVARRGELIGLDVKVVGSKHPPYLTLQGRVVDETKNTFLIDTRDGSRVVPKIGQRFQFLLPDGSMAVLEGAHLVAAPEERIKFKRFKSSGGQDGKRHRH